MMGERLGEGGVGFSHEFGARRRRRGRARGRFALPCAHGHDFAAGGQGETGMASVQAGAARVRQFGAVNWVGVYTLCRKEVHRFMKIPGQTIGAPAVTALLFLAIFSVALGRAPPGVAVGYLEFLAPGLIMMSAMQNAFANTSSTLIISKVQGTIVDVLMPPLSPGELAFCYAVSGAIRGLVVGVVVAIAMYAVVPFTLHSVVAVVFFSLATALVLSLIGMIVGIWGIKFDNIASVTNFVIIPLSMLSGTFYSVEQLPGVWRTVSRFNPFFYMIDGARYGFTGHHDGALWIGYVGLSALTAALAAVAYAMLKRGYRLKA
jgi:ABC-2 type transport system permease protein